MCKPGDKAYILGIALSVISGLVYSVYIVLLGKSNLSSVPALTLSFWLCLFSAVEIGVVAALMGKLSFTISRQGWLAEFMLALFSTVFALILFQKGLFLCGEVRASLLSTFEPITSVMVGIIAFNEKITLKIILGIVAILLSTIFLVIENNEKLNYNHMN
ncbi:MAG: DMT family transporter, partial [Clostridia bacterium]|nr:DMT family transporter [Clostridia bacterium]